MKVLAKINFRTILYFGIIEVLITILLCYILAVTLQHKPVWLPTISECGELPPEKYFFRWGILVGGLLLVVEADTLHNAKRVSNLVYSLGLVAGFCLTGVAVCASNENITVHLIFALSFFGLEDLMILLMLLENYHSLSLKSLALKVPSTAIACTATAARFLIVSGVLRYTGDVPIVAIVEWINVGAFIAYHLTLADDLNDLYLAELEDEPAKAEKQSPITKSMLSSSAASTKTPL